MESTYNVYLLQYGAYTDMKVLNENIKKLDNYVIKEENDKYYVYLGIYTNYENAYTMHKIFKNDDIYTFIKSDYITNSSLIDKISLIDRKFSLTEKESEIISFNKDMLNIYKKELDK